MPRPFQPATPKDKSAPVVLVKVQQSPTASASSASRVVDLQARITTLTVQVLQQPAAQQGPLRSQLEQAKSDLSKARADFNTSLNQAAKDAAFTRVDVSGRLVSLEYEDTVMSASRLTLTIDNFDGANHDNLILARGRLIQVQWGYPSDMSPPRTCRIKSVLGGQQLKIEAWGRAIDMNREKRSRKFEGPITRAEIARRIAQENGYTGRLADIEDTGVKVSAKSQANMTDAQFLRKLAKEEGFEWCVDFDGFHFAKARFDQRPIRELRWYTAVEQGDILSYDIENDITGIPGRVVAKGRDPITKKPISKEAKTELVLDAQSGFSHLETVTVPSKLKNEATIEQQANNLARVLKRAFVRLKLEVVGDPSMLARAVVQVTGIAGRVDGPYYVRTVKHKVDTGGYKMTVEAVTDRSGGKPSPGSKSTPADRNAANANLQFDAQTGQGGAITYDTQQRGRGQK